MDNTGGAREATFSNGLILTLFTSLEIDAPLNEYIPQELIPNIMAIKQIFIIIQTMDYNKDDIAKDKAQTWKTFNKLTIYTIIFVAIILIIIFSLF